MKRRRWTASSLAKQYRDCLDAGDRACARDAAERIQRSSSPTAQKVVRSARAHGLLGFRGTKPKRGLRGTPVQHEEAAINHASIARMRLREIEMSPDSWRKPLLLDAWRAAQEARTECSWVPSAPVCAEVKTLMERIRETPEEAPDHGHSHGMGGARRRRTRRSKRALGFLPPEHLRRLEQQVKATRETEMTAAEVKRARQTARAGDSVGHLTALANQIEARLHDEQLEASVHARSVLESRLSTPAQKRRARELLAQQQRSVNLARGQSTWVREQDPRVHAERRRGVSGVSPKKRKNRG